MKNYYFLYFLVWLWALLGSYAAAAQAPAPINSGSLTGMVARFGQSPASGLRHGSAPTPAPGETLLSGAAADDQGQFKLSQLPAGTFRLRVLFVGYAPRTLLVTVGFGATVGGFTLQLPTFCYCYHAPCHYSRTFLARVGPAERPAKRRRAGVFAFYRHAERGIAELSLSDWFVLHWLV
ncbi:MAG: hypothetical protein ACRYF0_12575 [Janthinobacterium lividum]